MTTKMILGATLFLLMLLFQCCPSNVGQKIGEATPSPGTQEVTVFKVGDIVQAGGHTVTLNSAEASGGVLTANFTVENTGDKEMIVSSLLSFEARKQDGTKLNLTLCQGSGLDGKVLVGDRMRGDLCWNGVSATAGIRIYYKPSLFGSGAIVWELD